MIFQVPAHGQRLLARMMYCNVMMEHIAMGRLKDGHVATTKGEEGSAQRIIQLCARTKIVRGLIIVVTNYVPSMVDPDSVNKRVSLREVI